MKRRVTVYRYDGVASPYWNCITKKMMRMSMSTGKFTTDNSSTICMFLSIRRKLGPAVVLKKRELEVNHFTCFSIVALNYKPSPARIRYYKELELRKTHWVPSLDKARSI